MSWALPAQASLGAGEGEEKAEARWAGPAGRVQCVQGAAAMGSAVLWRREHPDPDVLSRGFRPTCDLAWLSWLVTVGLLELVSSHPALGWQMHLITTWWG